MLKKKLNISLVILLLALFLGLFSTSYTMAYSSEDFYDFLIYCRDNNINNNNGYNADVRNTIINNWQTLNNLIESNGDSLSNYNNFTLGISGSSNLATILCYNGTINYNVANNGYVSFTSTTFTTFYIQYSALKKSTKNITSTNYYFLFDGIPSGGTWYNNVLSINQWCYINLLPRDNLTTSNLPWYIADIFIGSNTSGTPYLYHNNEQIGETQTISTTNANGTLYQFEILNTNGLISNENYQIRVINANSTLVNTGDFELSWTISGGGGGDSPSSSGDSGGNCNCVPYLIEILDVLSGDVVRAIDNNGNIVVGTLSELQQQLQANNQILDDIKSGLFGSGDSGDGILGGTTLDSGDTPTIEDLASITIPDEDDPSHEFFTWLLNQIISVLEDDNEQTLIIPIYKTDYEIRSDVFKLEIEPLRTFIQARLVVYCRRSVS